MGLQQLLRMSGTCWNDSVTSTQAHQRVAVQNRVHLSITCVCSRRLLARRNAHTANHLQLVADVAVITELSIDTSTTIWHCCDLCARPLEIGRRCRCSFRGVRPRANSHRAREPLQNLRSALCAKSASGGTQHAGAEALVARAGPCQEGDSVTLGRPARPGEQTAVSEGSNRRRCMGPAAPWAQAVWHVQNAVAACSASGAADDLPVAACS